MKDNVRRFDLAYKHKRMHSKILRKDFASGEVCVGFYHYHGWTICIHSWMFSGEIRVQLITLHSCHDVRMRMYEKIIDDYKPTSGVLSDASLFQLARIFVQEIERGMYRELRK